MWINIVIPADNDVKQATNYLFAFSAPLRLRDLRVTLPEKKKEGLLCGSATSALFSRVLKRGYTYSLIFSR